MDIQITPDTLLSDIREEFRKRFPNLDIAFFSQPHTAGQGSHNEYKITGDVTAGEAGDPDKKGTLTVNGLSVVHEVEEGFKNSFGLYAQILRKSGDIWLQTITTDHKTLAEINAMGRNVIVEENQTPEEDSYREQE
ncbi:MAG: hypothetical protein MH137_10990 [Flavobacteriales bacterium]|nr:hypothetical protein [Flavobacteriales bacterium]